MQINGHTDLYGFVNPFLLTFFRRTPNERSRHARNFSSSSNSLRFYRKSSKERSIKPRGLEIVPFILS